MENSGMLGLGLNLRDRLQTNKPKMPKAPKWATLSRWGISPKNSADGRIDSRKRILIQLIIMRLSRMIALVLFTGVGGMTIVESVDLPTTP